MPPAQREHEATRVTGVEAHHPRLLRVGDAAKAGGAVTKTRSVPPRPCGRAPVSVRPAARQAALPGLAAQRRGSYPFTELHPGSFQNEREAISITQ